MIYINCVQNVELLNGAISFIIHIFQDHNNFYDDFNCLDKKKKLNYISREYQKIRFSI